MRVGPEKHALSVNHYFFTTYIMLASELPKLLTEPTKIFLENQNFVIFEEVVDNFDMIQ